MFLLPSPFPFPSCPTKEDSPLPGLLIDLISEWQQYHWKISLVKHVSRSVLRGARHSCHSCTRLPRARISRIWWVQVRELRFLCFPCFRRSSPRSASPQQSSKSKCCHSNRAKLHLFAHSLGIISSSHLQCVAQSLTASLRSDHSAVSHTAWQEKQAMEVTKITSLKINFGVLVSLRSSIFFMFFLLVLFGCFFSEGVGWSFSALRCCLHLFHLKPLCAWSQSCHTSSQSSQTVSQMVWRLAAMNTPQKRIHKDPQNPPNNLCFFHPEIPLGTVNLFQGALSSCTFLFSRPHAAMIKWHRMISNDI